jgi:hypothetical protein
MEDQTAKLIRKLGIKPDQAAYVLHAPDNYVDLLGVSAIDGIGELPDRADWLQAFYLSRTTLADEIGALKARLSLDGQLWICWPKKASRIETDLSDEVVRRIGLDSGLVDVKIAAIDDVWSGLKLVYRLQDRKLVV